MSERAAVFHQPACLRAALAITAVAALVGGCGKDKPPPQHKEKQDAQAEPTAEQPKSVLTQACDGDPAEKATCLCRLASMRSALGDELMKKLENVPNSSTDDAMKHVGGIAQLSKIHNAMRKAGEQCAEGAGR